MRNARRFVQILLGLIKIFLNSSGVITSLIHSHSFCNTARLHTSAAKCQEDSLSYLLGKKERYTRRFFQVVLWLTRIYFLSPQLLVSIWNTTLTSLKPALCSTKLPYDSRFPCPHLGLAKKLFFIPAFLASVQHTPITYLIPLCGVPQMPDSMRYVLYDLVLATAHVQCLCALLLASYLIKIQ